MSFTDSVGSHATRAACRGRTSISDCQRHPYPDDLVAGTAPLTGLCPKNGTG